MGEAQVMLETEYNMYSLFFYDLLFLFNKYLTIPKHDSSCNSESPKFAYEFWVIEHESKDS